mmetsp:Transcript_12341/g.25126  ORF Transcript_12341/g.25126 Transcript_12341/m.25126 type:complete len:274 (-) Transcript_12341:267-1088(-)
MELSIDDLSLAGDGRTAVAIKCSEESSLAVYACLGLGVVQGSKVVEGSLVVGTALDTDGTLGNGGKHLVLFNDLSGVLLHVHALEASKGKHCRINNAIAKLLQTSLDVATEVDNLKLGVLCENLGLATEGSRTDDGSRREVSEGLRLVGDEHITGVLARKVARQNGALREVRRDVLHRVHADVHLVEQQLHIKLLGEQTLASDLSESNVKSLVTLRRDDVDRHSAVTQVWESLLQASLRLVSLGKRKWRATGTNAHRVLLIVRVLPRFGEGSE